MVDGRAEPGGCTTAPMNGAQSLVQTLANCGIEFCFANPGTSEMHFVAALDAVPAIRPVLCLFEGVATAAADGYGRVSGRPAATLLHLGPGLANGLANLHNARRASTPLVNIVGDHATYHREFDAPLTSDIIGFARPVSSWVHQSKHARSVAADAARAVQAARAAPGSIATLILPADTAWNQAERAAPSLPVSGPAPVSETALVDVARLLANGRRSALLLQGKALQGEGLEAAGRIQAKTGARLLSSRFASLSEGGAGRVPVERLPYFAEQIVACLQDLDQIILVGAEPPVAFFAYPGKPSLCAPAECAFSILTHPHEDAAGALMALADLLGASSKAPRRHPLIRPELPSGALNAASIGQIIAHFMPEHAIIADEALTGSFALGTSLQSAPPHLLLPVTGGSIGQALPLAIGAALAAPERKVICPHGDGGAAYTLQALWTMARENLNVTTVIYANRAYEILNIELQRVGVDQAGVNALSLFDLSNPEINWVKIAQGFGVEASRATNSEEFAQQFQSAMQQTGPRLIEAMM